MPWNAARRMEQIQLASNAMAYIHLSAKAAVERQFCHQREPLRFYSPLTFLEFVDLFKVIAAYTVKKERVGTIRAFRKSIHWMIRIAMQEICTFSPFCQYFLLLLHLWNEFILTQSVHMFIFCEMVYCYKHK